MEGAEVVELDVARFMVVSLAVVLAVLVVLVA